MFEIHQLSDGRNLLIERLGRPIVYLDNWALNDFALKRHLRERFEYTMSKRKGTLRLSVSNIVELLKQNDEQQREAILGMINSVDTGFINVNFTEVIHLENGLIDAKRCHYNPSEELGLITSYLMAQNWPEHWCLCEIIRHTLNNSSSDEFTSSYRRFSVKMEAFVEAVRNNSKYIERSSSRFKAIKQKGKKYETATRELFTMGMDFIFRNKSMSMTTNEWHDFYHTIVPVAYCDLVLIDGRWRTFIEQTGLRFPDIAMTFDKGSIDSFMEELENRKFV